VFRQIRLRSSVAVAAAPVAVAAAAPVANEDKVCRNPISGIVVKVSAQPGQSIQNGDILLVLKAMKIEANITALWTARSRRSTLQQVKAHRMGKFWWSLNNGRPDSNSGIFVFRSCSDRRPAG
jgi:acetyl/propionyl-CoA carboxylase alpha subunit